MPYYNEEVRDEIKRQIRGVYNSIDDTDFTGAINGIDVPSRLYDYKENCNYAASRATDQMRRVRSKLSELDSRLGAFYRNDVDETAVRVAEMAKGITDILKSLNYSFSRLNEALTETGRYEGKPTTANSIYSAGNFYNVLVAKSELRDRIYDLAISKNAISKETADFFVQKIHSRLKKGERLSANEAKNLDGIIPAYIGFRDKITLTDIQTLIDIMDHYIDNRYGTTGNAADLDRSTLKAVIAIYEKIDPVAKPRMNSFLKPAYALHNLNADHNADLIKYGIYTSKADLRDLMLSYIPKIDLKDAGPSAMPFYDPKLDAETGRPSVNINLTEDPRRSVSPFGSFFHMFGHAVDDLSQMDTPVGKNASDRLAGSIKSDIYYGIRSSFSNIGYAYLGGERIDPIYDFLMSDKNINVTSETDDDHLEKCLPEDWSNKQKSAFLNLRDYYGYKNFTYLENGDNAYRTEDILGSHYNGRESTGIVNDILGFVTNGQLGGTGDSLTSCRDLIRPEEAVPNDRSIITGPDDIREFLEKSAPGHKFGFSTSEHASEFFAEVFDYEVRGADMEITRDYFYRSTREFDEIIEDIGKNSY